VAQADEVIAGYGRIVGLSELVNLSEEAVYSVLQSDLGQQLFIVYDRSGELLQLCLEFAQRPDIVLIGDVLFPIHRHAELVNRQLQIFHQL
jgi:hypothetical protein